jgi:hypothetical protein
MSRRAGTRASVAALLVAGAVLIPVSQAMAGGALKAGASDGPIATKSGVLVNFVPAGKLIVARHFQPLATCVVDCNVTGVAVLKGMGGKATISDSGTFAANQPFGLRITVGGELLKLMKAHPGRFRLNVTYTATTVASGGTESVSRGYKFKRKGRKKK